jgi:hypothetical protein
MEWKCAHGCMCHLPTPAVMLVMMLSYIYNTLWLPAAGCCILLWLSEGCILGLQIAPTCWFVNNKIQECCLMFDYIMMIFDYILLWLTTEWYRPAICKCQMSCSQCMCAIISVPLLWLCLLSTVQVCWICLFNSQHHSHVWWNQYGEQPGGAELLPAGNYKYGRCALKWYYCTSQ